LVYTSSHVAVYRKDHPEHSWLRAFWQVLKSGGDRDSVSMGRRIESAARSKRKSARKEPIVVEMDIKECSEFLQKKEREDNDLRDMDSMAVEEELLENENNPQDLKVSVESEKDRRNH